MKNIIGRSVLSGIIIFFFFNILSFAHGINFETSLEEPPVVTVKASYSGTAHLVDAVVEIFAPGDDMVFQRGRTDRAGYFVFMPDRTGEWIIRVDDERGHVDKATISVSDIFLNSENGDPDKAVLQDAQENLVEVEKDLTDRTFPVIYSAITGLVLIFGLTGIVYGIKAHQKMRRNNNQS